jgi:MscS family membrane protein
VSRTDPSELELAQTGSAPAQEATQEIVPDAVSDAVPGTGSEGSGETGEAESSDSMAIVADDSSIEAFWSLVTDVWTYGVGGIDMGEILIALGIVFLGLMVRQLFSRLILKRIETVAARTTNRMDDTLATALADPIRFVPVVVGVFIATEYLALSGTAQDVATALNRSLIVFVIFWGLFRMVDPMSFVLGRVERVFTAAMVEWLIKAIKLLVALIGFATVLEIWGIQVGPILAGLGLFGVAVALGAQDLFKNLIAGILILVEKRFSIGEWIRVDGVVEGTVESIGFRSTFIRRFDKAPVFVPNAQLSDSAVTNFSRMTHRRIYWMIGLEYRTTVAQLRQVRDRIEEYVTKNEAYVPAEQASLFVRVDSFNDSSIDIMLYVFTKTTVWGEWMQIKEELALAIKQIVEEAGTGFAFPSRSLYVETVPGETPEVFSPPEKDAPKQIESQPALTERTESAATRSAKKTAKKTAKKPGPKKAGAKTAPRRPASHRGPSDEDDDGN